MALSAVSAAVEARLAANWTRTPVRGLNESSGDTPTGSGPFLVVQYPVAQAEQITFGTPGSNVYRDSGAIRFVLNVRRGKGVIEPLTWIDELAALFRGKTFGGVRTYAPSQPVIDDRNEDGPYFALSFSVPFDHDVIG